ncbi:MAG: sigma-54 dependent transcriptional regulator [Chromatiaceae bacterium]|jgi:sigma-54 dependent transcriptional regulator, flagellar regulatory protein
MAEVEPKPAGSSLNNYQSARERIIILDQDEARAGSVESIISFLGYHPAAVSPANWSGAVGQPGADVSFIIGRCGSTSALSRVLKDIHEWDPSVPVCLMDLDGESAGLPIDEDSSFFVRSVKFPLRQPQLANALEQGIIFRDSRRRNREGQSIQLFRALVGCSRGVERVRHLIQQVAPTDATVLVLGETGTGKEIVARNIHYYSKRRKYPFVPVNCGAIPAELLESELFGHEKGSFTGAITSRQGRFELANGGTLFLDEIGDMPLPMQVKLLRVLQEQTFERVGGTKTVSVNVRVVAATHRDMEQQIAAGQFREDLYYRLNVFPIETPSLRDRVEDLPLLIGELIARLQGSGKGSLRLTARAVDALSCYSWPGNVRELANLVERLAILHPFGLVDVADLPEKFVPAGAAEHPEAAMSPGVRDIQAESAVHPRFDQPRLPREGIDLREHLSRQEVSLINQALDETAGVVAQAASLLGMRRTTLVEKMRKYGIQRQE